MSREISRARRIPRFAFETLIELRERLKDQATSTPREFKSSKIPFSYLVLSSFLPLPTTQHEDSRLLSGIKLEEMYTTTS